MSNRPNLGRGLLIGAAAGIAATLVMDQFQKFAQAGQKAIEKQKKLAEGESAWAIAHERRTDQGPPPRIERRKRPSEPLHPSPNDLDGRSHKR